MLKSARSRYVLAAALWAAAVAWLALGGLQVPGVYPMLLVLATTATVCAALVERDERMQQTIRLTWWASACAHSSVPPQRRGQDAPIPVTFGDPR